LLRRAHLGAAFGHYQGRRYRSLAGVATALAALAGRECAYLPDPLSSYQPGAAAPAVDTNNDPPGLQAALERLHLLYEAHTRQHFLTDTPKFKALLAARLDTLTVLVRQHHERLAAGDPRQNDTIQQALRQGYQLLLAPP
jgi:hypothetical protein